ncbi:hypothetical protein SARC_10036 [Sphaeroforma arctica JP610]|uniref:NOL1/NOP2/Sun domain family member 4 n=1 Tax=Sphaeroforma arctica JP610 TaxID=667725 RepID=A0A0L0FLZ5_9EUKA|nr:hypothetical protein SARC_10036 [Sphaeroforma arctica JP610]KNC77501.1 hypothetical protein SARC_10036 [Sphaeroforma arctica JP610]|eukprot:XP_014151403.1 hypothetical protein SARC_10036 [Sphaeroforma arctica JP610]
MLKHTGTHSAWDNLFYAESVLEPLDLVQPDPKLPCYLATESVRLPSPTKEIGGLTSHYLLDLASTLPALTLKPQPGEAVLDMCAAPGGKSLILATLLFATRDPNADYGHLTMNEIAPARRTRLRRVLDEHIPAPLHARLSVTMYDATKWSRHQTNQYDKILVDAPCSSERHHCQTQMKHRKAITREEWSVSRSKRNAVTQLGLLVSACQALRPGGRVVYSTCSICNLENDDVVRKALAKLGDTHVRVVSHENPTAVSKIQTGAEKTEFGYIVLPDTVLGDYGSGWGPLFWSVIERLE